MKIVLIGGGSYVFAPSVVEDLLIKSRLSDNTLIPCSFVLQFYLFRALESAGMYQQTETLWELWKGLIEFDTVINV